MSLTDNQELKTLVEDFAEQHADQWRGCCACGKDFLWDWLTQTDMLTNISH